MRVRFADEQAARAAGMTENSLALQTSLTVREVLVILGNLYPGFGAMLHRRLPAPPGVYLNGRAVEPDTPVSDSDLLEILPVD
ncbi:MAG TPA: MoaD/ThiS family protein [Symbiobacteriaceae bacterium]|jgi:hypothetical protein|nr:MoaD/ThiS family protein [Symbiobacteriaceae bacterium]